MLPYRRPRRASSSTRVYNRLVLARMERQAEAEAKAAQDNADAMAPPQAAAAVKPVTAEIDDLFKVGLQKKRERATEVAKEAEKAAVRGCDARLVA